MPLSFVTTAEFNLNKPFTSGLIMGAKLAAPDKFCVNFMGDAAFGMTGLDFETAVRCNIMAFRAIVIRTTELVVQQIDKICNSKLCPTLMSLKLPLHWSVF